ncbi:hypothetical protein GCM10007049_37230 [Echinicola pacifica]|uniref:Uncharacterized protein n=1 Tax=Echinicola pacifica TaxID=346377 RepID=A0A918QBZ5_9BACT|nr:hypothetical protein [Echinicola pacifica]GGZ40501.1 hypothetical protein GCM10007049_37230 [Echinicola pacifica]
MDSYDIMLYVGYLLIGLGALAAVLMPLIKSFDNPQSLLKMGAGLIGVAALFFIAYSIASDEVLPKYAVAPFNLTPSASKAVGGILFTTYILSGLALVGIAVTEVNKLIK